MKDLVEVRFTVATKEIDGKVLKGLGKVVKPLLKKYESKIDLIVDKLVEEIIEDKIQQYPESPEITE